ncbi:MAG: hypothetical protein NT069_03650 [Planctomycetota bacterium]|nr:hypothetical protein [Planctomycetota bacterium]
MTIDGGGTVGLASRTLSVASGQRHTGIASTGAVFRPATTGKGIVLSIANTTLEWLDIDENALSINSTVSSTVISTIQRCIVRGAARSTATASHLIGIAATSGAAVTINVHHNLVYALTETGTGAGFTIGINDAGSATRPFNANNNTVYNLINDGGTGGVTMLSFTDGSGKSIRNNLCVTNSGTGSGAKACYPTTSASAFATNLSSDTSGTSGLTSKTAANQFVATTGGSEDLHLKAGADAIGVGTDLVTTPSGVQIDIDGYDRDATGVTWDVGADEYVAIAAVYVPFSINTIYLEEES